MAERLSREELYDLVWSKTMGSLSTRFGVSNAVLKQTCQRAAIPMPGPSHWTKKAFGKETLQAALPARLPGMDNDVVVGQLSGCDSFSRSKIKQLYPPPRTPPEFPEPIEAVRERIAKAIGEISVPDQVLVWHPTIDYWLKEDEKCRQKLLAGFSSYSFDKPQLDTPFEQRRLRILNSLFFAIQKMNGDPWISFYKWQLNIGIGFGSRRHHPNIRLALDRQQQSNRRVRSVDAQSRSSGPKLALSILCGPNFEAERMTWQDDDEAEIETRMTEIAIEVILTAEIQYRDVMNERYQLTVQRRIEIEEKLRQRRIARERAEKKRLRKIERARISRLLRDAGAFKQANKIRNYVEAIRSSQACDESSATVEFERWSQWALAQAERIDPAHRRAFLKAIYDEDGAKGHAS
jgi:hypothetical protein